MLCWHSHGLFISTSMDKGRDNRWLLVGSRAREGDGSEIFDVLNLTLILPCIVLLQMKRKFHGYFAACNTFQQWENQSKNIF